MIRFCRNLNQVVSRLSHVKCTISYLHLNIIRSAAATHRWSGCLFDFILFIKSNTIQIFDEQPRKNAKDEDEVNEKLVIESRSREDVQKSESWTSFDLTTKSHRKRQKKFDRVEKKLYCRWLQIQPLSFSTKFG